MDLRHCAVISLIEAFVLHGFFFAFPSPMQAALGVLAGGLFILQYTVVKFYRLFVYAYYISSLRHLPGPEVGHSQFLPFQEPQFCILLVC
jgi:hypothetical protein